MKEKRTEEKVKDFIEEGKLFNLGDKLLLACSAGSDSIFLVYALKKLGYTLGLLHCNFKLRGKEADEDECFVKKTATQLELPFYVKSFETKEAAKKSKKSIQETARILRYDFFEETRKENGFKYVLTAHHLNDQLETFFINLSRGGGINGLNGIPAKNGFVRRPLLRLSKEEILKYLDENKISYRNDSSNQSDKYLRNRIRHQLIPEFRALNEASMRHFEESLNSLSFANAISNDWISRKLSKKIEKKGGLTYLSIRSIIGEKYGYEILRKCLYDLSFNHSQIDDVWTAVQNKQIGAQFNSPTHKIALDATNLLIAENNASGKYLFCVEEESGIIKNASFSLEWKTYTNDVDFSFLQDENVHYLDIDKLQFPLLVRPWQAGDYLQPFGMKGKKKKVSDLLNDKKLNILEKESVLVLISNQFIAAVLGIRTDERFCVAEATKKILRIKQKSL